MADRHPLLRVSRLAVLIPTLVFFCLLVSYTSLFQYLEIKSYDMLLRLSPKRPIADRVMVVGIDDRSIASLGRPPWDRAVIGRLLERIDAGRPSAIGIDLFFDVPTDALADSELARSIRDSGKVVFPEALVSAQSTNRTSDASSHWLGSLPMFKPAAAGHANASPDADGICRRICLSWSVRGERFWAFGLEIFRIASGLPASPPLEKDDSLELGQTTIRARRRDGYPVLIHYSAGNSIPVLSAMDVLSDRWNAGIVRGKAVLIGAVSPLEGDQFFTPVSANGRPMPGVLVHANLVNTLMSGSFLNQSSLFLSLLLLVAVVLAVLSLMEWSRAPWHWIGTGAVCAAIIAAASVLQWHWRLIVPLPLLLFAALTATGAFHVQRLATVRSLLRTEIGRLAHQLPQGTNWCHLQAVVGRALTLLKEQAQWDWIDLRFLSGGRELMHFSSEARAGSRKEVDAQHHEFSDGEFHARILYPHAAGNREMQLLEIIGRAAAHYLAIYFRDQEVHRVSPGWKEALRRGKDEWQLGVLRQIGARWQANESSARAVLESISGGILILDFTGLIRYKNRTACRLLPFLNPGSDERDFFEMLQQNGFIDSSSARQYLVLLSFPDSETHIPLHCREWPRSDLLLRCSSIHSDDGTYSGVIVAISDVTDQKRLDAAKGEMVTLVSHELRTPLTSIHGFAQQLLRYSPDAQRIRHIAETIVQESKRLDQMTRAYLDLTRLEQHALEPHCEPVDLAGVGRDAVEAMTASAEDKNIILRLDFPESPVPVQGKPELLERAVHNLLSNAIKYSAAGKGIDIRVFVENGAGCIAVKDSGIGIPPDSLPHIFEKFYRVKSAAASQVSGSGLGLAYVQEVAAQFGGTVSVNSIVQQGSVFELRIPCWRQQ